MKKNYLSFILAIACSFTAFSQIPNGSFEDWTSFGTYEEPVFWSSYNSMTAEYGVTTCEKGSPGNPGNYYLKLTSKDVMGLAVLPGYAICGTLDYENETISGFPFTGRPANLTGKWQHMIFGNSQGMVVVQLTKWDESTQSQVLIASLEYTLTGMAMSWSDFSLPLTYLDSRTPDTCLIGFISGGEETTANDYLYVDNLSFSGNVESISESSVNNMQVYPNPAKNQITIECSNEIDQNGTITIVNLIGKTVHSEPFISNKQTLNIENLNNGIYFVTIKTKEGTTTQKVVVNK
jgi:hypothetical protein